MATVLGYRSAFFGVQKGLKTFGRPFGPHVRPHGIRKANNVRQCVRMCQSSAGNGLYDNEKSPEVFTITTPLYYANAAPHMGSAYPTIAADVISRYQRLQGKNVKFITGTDEHGEKIALAAQDRGLTPQQHCDELVAKFKDLWQELDISYTSFIRTTSPEHEQYVLEVLDKVWESGDIYLDQYEGWYCVDCEEYKDDAQMENENYCAVHKKKCMFRKEENYFFKLSKYQSEIEKLVVDTDFVQPQSRRNEVIGWAKSGLKDFSISRVAVDWGIRMQKDPKHTVYVWFDALNGYVSGLYPPGEKPSMETAVENGWPAEVHLIGKDILRFHAVYWPAMLLSAGLPLPKQVFGHGFLTKDGLKMGKSLGNVLDPNALVTAYGSDAVRYYFMKEVAFGQDGDFSEQRFRDIINANLANDIGNLLNRTLNLLKKNCGSAIPVSANDISVENPVRATASTKLPEVASGYDRFNFFQACEAILSISGRGNQFLDETAPWTAFKKGSPGEKAYAGEVLVSVLEAVRVVAVLLSPLTPELSKKIYLQLGFTEEDYMEIEWKDAYWGQLKSGHKVSPPDPVFKRIDGEFITEPAKEVALTS